MVRPDWQASARTAIAFSSRAVVEATSIKECSNLTRAGDRFGWTMAERLVTRCTRTPSIARTRRFWSTATWITA